MPIIVARDVKSISLKNVITEGFTEPSILAVNNAECVTQEGGTELPVEHVAGYTALGRLFAIGYLKGILDSM